MADCDYLTLADGVWKHEIVVEKSKFIAFAQRVVSLEELQQFLQKITRADATHNCYAWLTTTRQKHSDNGEPGGTAGLPILQAIRQNNLTDVAVVVVRYFGGIKLGTGGLSRAYGQVANAVLEKAVKITMRQCFVWDITVAYEHSATVERIGTQYGKILQQEFQDKVQYQIAVPMNQSAVFQKKLSEVLPNNIAFIKPQERIIAW